MEYYHELVTQKSWIELQKLKEKLDFVLIGGWATYLYTKTIKSKDIDILIDFDKLPIIEKSYQIVKNDRLKKYEALKGEVQIDIYLPHYSEIGIPVEDLMKKTFNLEGFTVLESNYLLALKIYTLQQRGRTPKGRKDFIDIIAIVESDIINWDIVISVIKEYGLSSVGDNLKDFLAENYELLELDINKHKYSQLKRNLLNKLSYNTST